MSANLFKYQDEFDDEPKGILWRMGGVALFAAALFVMVSLATYSWHDIPQQMSASGDASPVVQNWMGRCGARSAYWGYMLWGFGVWLVGPCMFALSIMMVMGRRIKWRPAAMLLMLISCSALLQLARGWLGGAAGPDGVNVGGDPGGRVGELLFDRSLLVWIGSAGAVSAMASLLALGLVFSIGPRAIGGWIGDAWHRWQERRLESMAEEQLLELEQYKAEREEEKHKAAEARRAAIDARIAEREAREQARAEERERKEQARAEREAERERRRAEKEAAREEKIRREQARKDHFDELYQQSVASEAARQAEDARRREDEEASRREAAAGLGVGGGGDVSYELPAYDEVFDKVPDGIVSAPDDSAEMSEKIVEKLRQFGVEGSVTAVVRGPVITRYEFLPAPGVRVNKIPAFAGDLQLALESKSIRILAPIPGRGVVGIEVPNTVPRVVPIGEVVRGEAWRLARERMKLPMLLGKEVSGDDLLADLTAMPHLLVAGSTNSGKSACINSILGGLISTRTPSQLRLILVDPKRVEFTPYVDLPHLVVPVITDPKKAGIALQWAISEMNKRLKIFSSVGVRNIGDFNKRKIQQSLFDEIPADGIPETLPYIVIVMDEIADMMMVAQAEVENRIARLAQLARAVGIHMILATQRPSVKIITGSIKANIPGRVAFHVISTGDSRTILDQGGADALIGRGDMLFMSPKESSLIRAQGTWINDDETRRLVDFMKAQGEPQYEQSIKDRLDKTPDSSEKEGGFDAEPEGGSSDGEGGDDDGDGDEAMLRMCLQVIQETRRASTSQLQRRLKIGYNRAARLMDELEARGYIGPANGSEPREILRLDYEPPARDGGGGAGGGDEGAGEDFGDDSF